MLLLLRCVANHERLRRMPMLTYTPSNSNRLAPLLDPTIFETVLSCPGRQMCRARGCFLSNDGTLLLFDGDPQEGPMCFRCRTCPYKFPRKEFSLRTALDRKKVDDVWAGQKHGKMLIKLKLSAQSAII